MFKVLSDNLLDTDSGNLSVLVELDSQPATPLIIKSSCAESTLRTRWVEHRSNRTFSTMSTCSHDVRGFPQGSVLGAMFSILWRWPLSAWSMDLAVRRRACAARISACMDDTTDCMRSNRFLLISAKTEIIWSFRSRRLHQPPLTALQVGSDHAEQLVAVRYLGILLDADISMKYHAHQENGVDCFFVMQRLRSIRRSVPRSVLQSLVMSLDFRRLN